MQAIILAAGRGTRMAPLTDTTPKPMLKVLDKNLIEWKLEALPQGITSILLVVNYLREQIRDYFGTSWNGIPITYVAQEELNGTGGALVACQPFIKDKALVLMGDDIYEKKDLEELCKYDFSILVQDQGDEGLKRKGQIVEKDGLLAGINEGSSQTGIASPLINTGACVISLPYFEYPPVQFTETEYGLPHTLVSFSQHHPIHIVHATKWTQITTPECIQKAESAFSTQI